MNKEIKLADFQSCTGCAACHDSCKKNAITLQYIEGFAYPVINSDLCVSCGSCERACPILTKEPEYGFKESPSAFYGYSNNNEVRMRSTSGGISYEFNKRFIEEGGVVYGVGFDSNHVLHYQRADTLNGIDKFVGSKYLQACSEGIYISVKKDIENGKKVLFTGLPCVLSGLRCFLKKEELEKVTVVKIICHGISSPVIFNSVYHYYENKYNSKIVDYNFRSKSLGWERESVCVSFANGRIINELALNNIHHYWFAYHWNMRLSCFNCRHRTVNEADVIIGDWWGVNDYKKPVDKNKGISVIIANTAKGESLLGLCKGRISLTPITLREAISRQTPLYTNPEVPKERATFLEDFFNLDFNSFLIKYKRHLSFKEKIKKIVFEIKIYFRRINKYGI